MNTEYCQCYGKGEEHIERLGTHEGQCGFFVLLVDEGAEIGFKSD